jgi:hypothetical protein
MPVALKTICYLTCVAALFLAVYMEGASKNASSKSLVLIAQQPQPDDHEAQLRTLIDQSENKSRIGLISAAIGAVLMGVCFYWIKPKTTTDSVGAGLLKAPLIIMLTFYMILKLAVV